jgi:hypothetical protein
MKNIFGSYMRTRDMEDAQGSYNHEDEIKVYISAWEMQRPSPMDIEAGWSLWSWLRL